MAESFGISPITPRQASCRLSRAIEQNDLCFVCEDELGSCSVDELSAGLGARQICHKGCYNGSHALARIMQSLSDVIPEAKQKLADVRANNLPMWRGLCQSLVAEGQSRSTAQRGRVRAFVEEMVRESKVSRNDKILLMNNRQFVAWHIYNEMMSESDAQQKYHLDVNNKSIYREIGTDGQVLLAVRTATEIVFSNSVAKKQRVTSSVTIADDNDARTRMSTLVAPSDDSASASAFANIGGGIFASGASSSSALVAGGPCVPSGGGGGHGIYAMQGLEADALSHASSTFGEMSAVLQPTSSSTIAPTRGLVAAAAPLQLQGAAPARAPRLPLPAAAADESQEGESDASTFASAFTIDPYTIKGMPGFVQYKKELKAEVARLVLLFNSAQKGKTLCQLLKEKLEDDELANDEQIQALESEDVMKRAKSKFDGLKHLKEKIIPLWRHQAVKKDNWKDIVKNIHQNMDEWEEVVDELKQLVQVVGDVRIGMKKETQKAKKAVGYKITKYSKVLRGAGYPEEVCRIFSEAFCKTLESPLEGRSAVNDASGFKVWGADATSDVAVYMKTLARNHAVFLQQESLALLGQMKSTTIMKPLTLPQLDGELAVDISSITLHAGIKDAVHRPWLLMASAFASTWGPMRWPFVGLPSVITCLDNYVVLLLVPMQNLLQKTMSLDTCDWFGEGENKLRGDDFNPIVLSTNESVAVPFGYACLWCFMPGDGAIDSKPDKSMKGKLVLQWMLPASIVVDDVNKLAATEIKHVVSKHLSSQAGDKKPWVDIKASINSWVDMLP
jgi:hypothetical protein